MTIDELRTRRADACRSADERFDKELTAAEAHEADLLQLATEVATGRCVAARYLARAEYDLAVYLEACRQWSAEPIDFPPVKVHA